MESRVPLLALLVLALAGCRESQPTADPREDELMSVYAEMLVLNEQFKATASPIDTAEYRRKIEQLLSSHRFSKEEFYSAIDSQFRSAEKSRRFHEKLSARLEQRKPKP